MTSGGGVAQGAPAWFRVGAVVVAVGYGVGTVGVILEREARVTSYFAATQSAMVAGLAGGLGVLLVGGLVLAATERPAVGWLALLLGVTWLAPVWSGWEAGPAVVGSFATVASPLLVPLVAHVWLLGTHGPTGPGPRRAVAATYLLFGALVLGRAAVHDPHRDRYCWVDCGLDANVFVVHPATDLARGFGVGLLWSSILVTTVVVAGTLWRATSREAVRPVSLAIAAPALLALVAEAGYAVFLLLEPGERFDTTRGTGLFLARSCALIALTVGIAFVGVRARMARVRMAALVRDLGSSPGAGELRAHLSRALGDDGLDVLYWSALEGRYLDAAGRPVDADDSTGTRLVRGGKPVALVRHDPNRVPRSSLERAIGSTARLVLDNERLRAEVLGQVEELRRSRARVVAEADEHRRALERDLHDGAQQRLLAATYELRLARAEALTAGEGELAERLDRALGTATEALAELRDVAHGLFPAVLDEAGLVEALWSLTDEAAVPVELDVHLDGQARPETERVAYLVAQAAIEAARTGQLTLTVVGDGEGIVVEVAGVVDVDRVHLADRVSAAGGSLSAEDGALRAVIP